MLINRTAPTAAWHCGPNLHAGSDPVTVLRQPAAELATLADRVAGHMRPGRTAVGLLRYDAALPRRAALPAAAEVQIFDNGSITAITAEDLQAITGEQPFSLTMPFNSDMSREDYQHSIQRIHRYLRAGDCYQVNFARRFRSHFQGNAFAAWARLLLQHPAPHSSFFQLGNGDAVFGVSPERFLRIDGRAIVSQPIKGSRPRGNSAEDDRKIGEGLQRSSKDLAENLMIVDLLRNDLGRICVAGSVTAAPLFELRRFSNVQHLVSTVAGTLRDDVSPLQALLSCFPGGSITGAPKKRAMEIIDELEPVPRGFYCGSQFVLDSDGNLDSNILIRTFQTHGNQIICHGGGGIVIDSDAEQEYQESLFKVEKLMAALL